MSSPRVFSEFQIHKLVVERLQEFAAPGIFWFHPFNRAASPRQGKMAKDMGVVAGVPDLIIFQEGLCWCLEIKAIGGKLSNAQKATHEAINDAGIDVYTVSGYDEAIALFQAHGVLP